MKGTSETTTLEEGCFAVTYERKYFRREDTFIKRSLRPREYRIGYQGLHIPRVGMKRLRNEAASLKFIRKMIDISVLILYCDFEDDDAYYVVTQYVQGVSMSDLTLEQKKTVSQEIKIHLSTLRTLTSNTIGGPSGHIVPPYRVMERTENDTWTSLVSEFNKYVFCHNDLSQQNIIVDPETLKINAIIDWEYAGFYPEYFEALFYTRLGPSVAMKEESDDTSCLLAFLLSEQTDEN